MRWSLRRNKVGLSCRYADQRGFTLVEILVSVAIIAIMAGIMVPLMDKVWLSNEKDETREKIADLKRAMVGDKRLVQNGIRMHYGFVGDYGILPAFIADLVIEPNWVAPRIWPGPYLVGAFDMKDYYNDAWHRELTYTTYDPPLAVVYEVAGHPDVTLHFAATIKSRGFDGTAGTDDDIDERSNPELQILESEVWPTNVVQFNQDYVFTTATNPQNTTARYGKVYAECNVPAGKAEVPTDVCFPLLSIGDVAEGESQSVHKALSANLASALPVGLAVVRSRLYSDSNCQTEVAQSNDVSVYISEELSTLTVNLPTINNLVN